MRSHKLSNPAELTSADSAYDTVFQSATAFDEPFRDQMEHRLILYPTHSPLEDRWLIPLCRAATAVGDEGFYAKWLEREYAEREGIWYIALSNLEPYQELQWISATNALFSPAGKWGVLLSNESVTVVGAARKIFTETLANELDTSIESQVSLMLEEHRHYSRFGAPTEPFARLLRHVFGEERARGLLASYELSA